MEEDQPRKPCPKCGSQGAWYLTMVDSPKGQKMMHVVICTVCRNVYMEN